MMRILELRHMVLVLVVQLLAVTASAQLRVVTSVPDLADFVREVGGEAVTVTSIATGVEDPHALPLKPSFLPILNRADAVVILGLGYEHAYMPGLLEASRNPAIQPGTKGYIDVSVGITPLDLPASLDRAEGEVHPEGNPHYNLDPENVSIIIRNLVTGLSVIDPGRQQQFEAGGARYVERVRQALAEWQVKLAPLRGMGVVSYHSDFRYFLNRFGLREVGTIETKPGIEPTLRHLDNLRAVMVQQNVKLILREPHFNPRIPLQLAEQVGGKVLELPIMVGGTSGADTYLTMMNSMVDALHHAATVP